MRTMLSKVVLAGLICILGAGVGMADLKGYWKLNETSGSAVNDEMSTTDGTAGSSTSWVAGKFGNALSLPGGITSADQWLNLNRTSGALNVNGTQARTYSLWAKIPSAGNLYFHLLPIGDFRFWWYHTKWRCQNVGGTNFFDDNTEAPNNTWRHYTVCVTSSRARWYLDGTFMMQAASANVNTANHSSDGIGYGNRSFLLDDYAILDEFLGAAKIALVYKAGNNATLKYDFGKVWSVFQGHAAQATVRFDDRWWEYAGGLSGGAAGDLRDDGGGQHTMFITSATGMSSRDLPPDGTLIMLK